MILTFGFILAISLYASVKLSQSNYNNTNRVLSGILAVISFGSGIGLIVSVVMNLL